MPNSIGLLAQVYGSYSPAVQVATTFLTVFVPIMIIFAVIMIASYWIIFQKAGQPGWASIIPFYNVIIMLRIIGKPAWWLLVFICVGFIPIIGGLFNLVVGVYFAYLFAKSFGKDVGFTAGMIFLPFIFYPILAFGSAQYMGPAGASPDSTPAPSPMPPSTPTMPTA
jgi:hypothetical protein